MADSFIVYIPNPPNIALLTSSGKQSQWVKIQKTVEKIIENYIKNDFAHLELGLCDVIDKPLENLSHSHFFKTIKKIMEKIKDDFKEKNLKPESLTFNKTDNNVFNLTYKNIISLVYIIINIIENTTSKGKIYDIVHDFAYKNVIPLFKDFYISKQQVSKLIIGLDSIKKINICLYKDYEDICLNSEIKKRDKNTDVNKFKMDVKLIIFFSIFINAIFKSVLNVNIDLNIPPIDDYFKNNINPYLVNEEQIINLGNNYKDIFICNLILIKKLPNSTFLTNLNLKVYDSYQIELHNILTKTLDNNNINNIDYTRIKRRSKTITPNVNTNLIKNYTELLETKDIQYSPKFNNNYLYVQHLLSLSSSEKSNITKFHIDFNSLDPLLFNSVNYLLTKYDNIAKLKLIFFPHNKINKRKVYINSLFYNRFLNNDELYSNLYSTDDKKIYYQYIDQTEINNFNNNYILKDEKLLNEIFYSFNMNLRTLSIILEKKIKELLSLKIDFGTYNNKSISLFNYDNYNCSIVCFIFDLFRTFQSQIKDCKINSLKIFYEDFLDEKSFIVETIKRKIPSCKSGINLNNLKISTIKFNISNISLILPFENFPSVGLTELFLSNLTYNDLNNLVAAFKKNKNMFPLLIKLDISLAIMVEDYNKPVEILLKECLSPELVYFNMTLPFNVSIINLIDILYWIKCSHNVDTNIYLKMVHSELSQHINHYYFKNCVVESFNSCKYYFRKRNILPTFNVHNKKNITFILNKYDIKDINYFYNFIYCFNKTSVYGDNAKNRKIFENIFNCRGHFKKYEVEIEIIN